MAPNDLLTRADLHQFREEMLGALHQLVRPAAPDAGEFLSVDQVAQVTGYNRKTVLKWIHQGRHGLKGTVIKLAAYQFSTGIYSIKRGDLEAYGLATSTPTKPPKVK